MKKVLLILSAMMTVYFTFVPEVQSEKDIRIPDEAIRLRILAKSNSELDQQQKLHVRDRVNYYIANQVRNSTSKAEVRQMIEAKLPEIEAIIGETIQSNDFTVTYSETVPFPEKTYGNHVYPAGTYEALLITIGEGAGDNWWCVLFPPLCFVEFTADESVDEAEDEALEEGSVEEADDEEEEEGFRFFVLEWFGWS